MKINLITVCTDAYPMEYARKLITRFKELTEYDVDAYCITDRPQEIRDLATPIKPHSGFKGWWNKMMVYSDHMPKGYSVYMDIDTVLIQNFDEEMEFAFKKLDEGIPVVCVSDAINWMDNKYSSSMMFLKDHSMEDMWKRFEIAHWRIGDFPGGDQVWVGRNLEDEVCYIDETFPNLKLNLKFHLGEKIMGQWKFPNYLPVDCKIVDCGGKPKPHELQLPYIVENWHNVE